MVDPIFYAEIDTNITNAFFSEEEDNKKFYDYINDLLGYDIHWECEYPSSGIIDGLRFEVREFMSDHRLDVAIYPIPDTLTSEDYDILYNDKILLNYVKNELIAEFANWFNGIVKSVVVFPVHKDYQDDYDFEYLHFDGNDFYSMLYRGQDERKYVVFADTPTSLEALSTAKVEFYD
jgi:hypothetical protein